ncbi:MAG: hypothetical protein JXR36_09110 [Bacteroidales bacterium]|nr:hypothetical protein [Bacteroidales bacterium]
MKQKRNLIMLVFAAMFVFAACGGNSEKSSSDDSNITKQEEDAIEEMKEENEPIDIAFEFTLDGTQYKINNETVEASIIPFALYNNEDHQSLVWVVGKSVENPEVEISLEISLTEPFKNGTMQANQITLQIYKNNEDGQKKTTSYLSAKYIDVEFSSVKKEKSGEGFDTYTCECSFGGNFNSLLDDSTQVISDAAFSVKL